MSNVPLYLSTAFPIYRLVVQYPRIDARERRSGVPLNSLRLKKRTTPMHKTQHSALLQATQTREIPRFLVDNYLVVEDK